ncbi:hypothetical protein Shpa_41 [Paracoccus phage Shpa]|uniref:Uncharacterized protein n=1 Tax=Paracoccus phage Shpa TaxID=1647282 RepID=A0A0U2BXL0_9CAUD|nr:hypothetical protein FDG85_gp41 [Paracoccus phage Shpa]AKG94552.1 hypothetical protein Shpa_41 [Paracoccus phage Shpa]
MNKPAIHHITTTLGTDAICSALGVTPHSVRHARTTGLFPASWYDALSSMCTETGIPCPRNAFNWKARAKKHGAATGGVQGQGRKKSEAAQ